MPSHTQKLIPVIVILLLTGFATAAQIETPGDQGIVWQDSQVEDQLTLKCSNDISSAYIQSGNQEFNLETNGNETTFSSGDLTTFFSKHDELSWRASYDVTLDCGAENEPTSVVNFAKAEFTSVPDDQRNGIGFLGRVMKNETGSLGERDSVKLDPEISIVKEGSKAKADLLDSSFEFTGEYLSSSDEGYEMVEGYVVEEGSRKDIFKLYPSVDNYIAPDETSEVEFTGTGVLQGLRKDISFEPFVHVWSSEVIQDPGRRLTYDQVANEEYFYEVFMEYAPNDNFPGLEDDNFVLTVEEKGDKWDSSYKPMKNYKNMPILEWKQPESSSANYRIEISNYGKLDDLESGEYQFVLKLRYDDENFRIAEVPVEKKKQFSGQILDAGGNGVEADMRLTQNNGDTEYNLDIGSNGRFSKTIAPQPEEYDIEAEFFKRGQDRRDAKIGLTNTELDDSDLGSGVSAISFDYWENPSVDIEGLKPVNMMAAKFGYSIGGINDLRMAFDSGELDPRDIKVYECDEWNFAGQECLSQWSNIENNEGGNVQIDYTRWEAIIEGANLYDTGDGDILMSSYVIGTSSDLQLQESISLETTELSYNDDIGVSGVLVDESGDRVEDADVTLSLKNTDQFWNTTTDSTGTFRFDNKVQAEPGNYVLELTAEKAPYNSFSMESEATLQVSYEKGLETDAPADQTITQGETTSLQFEVTNTGQTEVSGMDVSVSGVKDQYIESVDNPDSIESGSTETVTVNLALPDDYCSDTCYPELNADVEGEAEGETVTASALLTTTLEVESNSNQYQDNESEDNQNTEEDDNNTENASSTQPEDEENSISGAFSEAQRMTGEFVEQQSDLNIALGLIMIFTLILAAAVKKKKGQDGNGRGGRMDDRSRPNIAGGTSSAESRVQRPDVSSKQRDKQEKVQEDNQEPEVEEQTEPETTEEPAEPEDEEVDEQEGASEDSEETDEEVPDDVCDICGEEFESATGVKIHKQAVH